MGRWDFLADQKPVALLNPSPHSLFAHPQLAEVLRTMGAIVTPETSVTIEIPRRGASLDQLLADTQVASAIHRVIGAFISGLA